MREALKSFEIIKKMYKYFVKKYRDLEPKLMICENEDFDAIEKELKALDIIKDLIYIDKNNQVRLKPENKTLTATESLDNEKANLLKEVLL